jgi:DNA-binding transcriptional LysR family regulator
MMDRLEEWRMFVAVASLRSFVGAARSLGRSPQTVTRSVAALEARLGTRLLHRTTRSVSLTGEGERQIERARRALAEMDLLDSGVDTAPALGGKVSITAPVLFGQLHVLPVVTEFLQKHPGLEVRLLLLDRVVSLAEEGIDVAVRIGRLPDSSLKALPLGQVRWVLCASPAYLERAGTPRTLEALSRHDCIAFTATTPAADRWTFRRSGRRERTVTVRPRLAVNTGQAAIDAAVAGVGIARTLSYQVAPLVAAGKLRVVLPSLEKDAVPVNLVQLPGLRTRLAEAFVELAAPRLRQRLDPQRAGAPRAGSPAGHPGQALP